MSFQTLMEQIDLLSNKSIDLSKNLSFSPLSNPLSEDIQFPDDRIIIKYIIISSSPDKISEEDAHFLSYGHKDTNSLEVNKEFAIPDEHPKMIWIRDKKKEVNLALKQIGGKIIDLTSAITILNIQIGSAVATIGSSAVILPFGSGLPTAFSALMSIFASLENFLTKVNEIVPLILVLNVLPSLLPKTPNGPSPETIIIPIITSLRTINTLLNTLILTTAGITALKRIIPIPPGSKDLDGNDTPFKEIEVKFEQKVLPNRFIEIEAIPSNGSWKYVKYNWLSSDKDEIINTNEKTIKIKMKSKGDTKYTCIVTDDKNNTGRNSIIIK